MSTSELLVKLLSGAAMGYSSSLISLKVIFGEYTLISNTNNYSDFKNHLAGNIEKHLLKESYIKDQIQTSKFKEEFNEIINDFINISLDKHIPDIKFKELNDYESLKVNLDKFIIENNFSGHIDINKILSKIDIKELFNDNQLDNLSSKIYQVLSGTITPEIKPLILDLYDNVKNKKISDILDHSILNKINNNIDPLLSSLVENLKSIEPEIDNIINNFWHEINADAIIDKLEENIKNKLIIDFIGIENKDKLTSELINHFIDFVKSDEGREFVNKLSKSLLSMAKEVDSPLINFLMPILQVRVFNFLEKNIPYFAENAKEWLRINKKEIEKIIEETIELYYSSQDLMGQFKLTVKDVIGLKITEYFQVVEKAILKFEDYINNNASQDITFKLVEFLDNVKISDLIKQLNINDENLSDFFHIFINNYLPKVNTKIFDSMLNKKIGDIKGLFKSSLKEQFGDKIQIIILSKIKDLIFSDYLIDKIKETIPQKLETFKNMSLGEIITKEKLEGYLAYLPMLLMFSQGKLINTVKSQINISIEGKNLSNLVDNDFNAILKNQMSEIYLKYAPELLNNLDDVNIKDIYYELRTKNTDSGNILNHLSKDITPIIENQLVKNLRLKTIEMSSDSLNNIIEKYIGNKYTPILFISLLVGTGFGFLIHFLESGLMSNQSYITPLAYFVFSIFISYIALQMLFKPYERSFAFKRKNIFADNVSQVLESDFRKAENIFTQKEQNNLKSYILKDNYDFLNGINNPKLTEVIAEKSLDYIYQGISPNKYSNLISDKIINFELNNIHKDRFSESFNKIFDNSQSFLTNFFAKTVYSYKDKDLTALPEKLRIEIEETVQAKAQSKLYEMINSLKDSDLTEKLKENISGIESIFNLDIKLNEAYNPDDNLKQKLIDQLGNIIKDKIPEGVNKYIEKNFIEDELSPDKEIGTLFNGELIKFARNNITFIIDRIVLEFGLEKIKKEKENISENIIKSVREANKDSFLYGLGESFFSIDSDIKNIVYLLIDTRLEPYLQEKKYELNSLLTGFIDFLSRKKLEELGLNNEILNSENINSLVNKFINHNNISASINHMSTALIEDILNLKISFILNLLGINNLKDIPQKLDEQINLIKNSFIENIESKEDLNNIINNFTKDLLNKGIFTQKLTSLFNDIDINEINNSIDNVVKDLYKTDVLNSYKIKFSESIYNNIESKKASDFITPENLQLELEKVLSKLLNDQELKIELSKVLNPYVSNLISKINVILPDNSKDYIIDIIVNSMSDSINKNGKDIIDSLETRNMIQKSINNISTPEMEALFSDITEFNFKKALVCGSIGAIIGIIDVIISKYYG